MSTDEERNLFQCLCDLGFRPTLHGIDGPVAWATFRGPTGYVHTKAAFDVTSTTKTVAMALVEQAKAKGVSPNLGS